jgi:hypothetical protein
VINKIGIFVVECLRKYELYSKRLQPVDQRPRVKKNLFTVSLSSGIFSKENDVVIVAVAIHSIICKLL